MLVVLEHHEEEALEELSYKSDFFQSLLDFYTENNGLTEKQAACLRERIAEDGL